MAFDILDQYLADPAHMPTKEILNDITPWPDDASEQFLGTNEVTVIKMDSPNQDDPSQPFYIFAKPNGKALWGKQKYPPCRDYPDSCNVSMTALKEYRPKPIVLQDIPHRHHPTELVIFHATYRCKNPSCNKIWWPKFSFADEKFFMTKRLVDLISRMSFSKRTFQTVAADTCCPHSVVRDVFKHECERRQALPVEAPEHIGIDEAIIHTKEGRHSYICLMDTSLNSARNGVLGFEMDSFSAKAAEKLFGTLQNPDNVKTITMDMSASFHAAAELSFPHARIIIDRFHVVQSLHNKTKETVSLLYEKLKRELETEMNMSPSPSFHDSDDEEDVSRNDLEGENLFDGKSVSDPSVFKSTTGLDAATRYRILKENYHPRWFVTNLDNLSNYALPRFHKLLETFPEFRNLYLLKEKMRYEFYNSATEKEARAIAREAHALLPPPPPKTQARTDVYKPMRIFFKTLFKGDFSPHIFEYFNDPVGQRYTNAKLENMNKIVKEVNAAARGLSLQVLIAKIVYGNLKETEIYRLANNDGILQDDGNAVNLMTRYMCFESGPKHFNVSPETVIARHQQSLCSFFDAHRKHTKEAFCELTDEDWFGIGAACAIQPHGKGIPANTVADIMKLKDAFVSGRAFEDESLYWGVLSCVECELGFISQAHGLTLVKVKEECRLPFRLQSWETYKNEYLAMVTDDSHFLENCCPSTPDL